MAGGVGICGKMCGACGRGDGMWQGVGSCGRVWGHIAGGWGM